MQNNKLTKMLVGLDLSENESLIYTTALSLGSSSILNLAKHSGIKRTSAYTIVSDLQQKGLMRTEIKGLKQLFVAESPENLSIMIDRKKETLEKNLPELMSLYNLKGGENTIKSYLGIEAMKNIYLDTLKDTRPHEDYIVIANEERWREVVGEKFAIQYIEARTKKRLRTRVLVQPSKTAENYKELEKNYNEEIKILPKGIPLEVDTLLLPAKLITFSLLHPYRTVVIENRGIVDLHKEMFEIIWKTLEN